MTAITQNLPWFVKDLGVSIVGKECYTSLVENLHLDDVKCLKYSLSKGLGIGIVLGGSIMKVPQILLITSARSARGLSLPAYFLETASYAITLAYAVRHDFPFSTYGENLFLTIQNTIITLLILVYSPTPPRSLTSPGTPKSQTVAFTGVGLAAGGIALCVVPDDILGFLQLTTLPLSLFSKLPQIRQNARARSTGQLSAFAVISQIAGCLARLFTTAQEVGDLLVSAGFALALLLNLILGAQLWMYWGQGDVESSSHIREKELEQEKRYAPAAWETNSSGSPIHAPVASRATASAQAYSSLGEGPRVSTPPPRTPSSAGGRKWARKVD
ncbi:mannose-P-dolichol utilization defect 1 protein [Pholiota conissans]|uniref:Mannose-P-dolichol utilization defect 1 protein n=1 Tax=Pholiota conissans TaxID=109636 RepID=A0A9P5ZD73_9AGAR|nr:mannose-P-dolichol utilization defect 1 protein [Pholiota conissans]